MNSSIGAPTVFDQDLPRLALCAAIELDRIKTDGKGSLDAVNSLAAKFKADSGDAITVSQVHMDVSMVSVMRRAFESRGKRIKTLSELVSESVKMVAGLSNIAEASLDELRDFCLALSQQATYASRSPRPKHKYQV